MNSFRYGGFPLLAVNAGLAEDLECEVNECSRGSDGWGLKECEEEFSLDIVAAVNEVWGECNEERGVAVIVPISSFLPVSGLLLPCELLDDEVEGLESPIPWTKSKREKYYI